MQSPLALAASAARTGRIRQRPLSTRFAIGSARMPVRSATPEAAATKIRRKRKRTRRAKQIDLCKTACLANMKCVAVFGYVLSALANIYNIGDNKILMWTIDFALFLPYRSKQTHPRSLTLLLRGGITREEHSPRADSL